MSNVKEKALAKMLKEMDKEHTDSETEIHNWLCKQTDDELFSGVMKKDKSISEALEYCGSKAQIMAMKGFAMVSDDEVFSWVKEYFVTDELEFEKQKMAVINSKSSEKPKKAKPKRKAKNNIKSEGEQLDLLSFL